jgi:TAG lipase / steryl ester hydrolase / phospholipase A2 / LPA acyltransferase
MGMVHIGVIKALFKAGQLPRIICGSSAGAIVAAILCTRYDGHFPLLGVAL